MDEEKIYKELNLPEFEDLFSVEKGNDKEGAKTVNPKISKKELIHLLPGKRSNHIRMFLLFNFFSCVTFIFKNIAHVSNKTQTQIILADFFTQNNSEFMF